MIIPNEALLDEFRGPGKCELCPAWAPRRDPHHVRCRGMAGGHRLDVRINVLASCRPCHNKIGMANLTVEGRRLTQEDLFFIVAQRERVSVDDIDAVLWLLARIPNRSSPWRIGDALSTLGGARLELAKRILRESKIEFEGRQWA